MPDFVDPVLNLNRSLMAIAEGLPPGSLGEAILASCEDTEMNPALLSSAVTSQLSRAISGLAIFKYHGGANLAAATDLRERAEDLFTLAAVFLGQAELYERRIAEMHDRRDAGNLVRFPEKEGAS